MFKFVFVRYLSVVCENRQVWFEVKLCVVVIHIVDRILLSIAHGHRLAIDLITSNIIVLCGCFIFFFV